MSQDLHCECGVAAMYWLAEAPEAEDRPDRNAGPVDTTPLVPGMLLDLHNRRPLASGISTFDPDRAQWVNTYKDVGTVADVFRTSHPGKHRAILQEYASCSTDTPLCYRTTRMAIRARATPASVVGAHGSRHKKRAARLSRTTTVQPINGKKIVPGTWRSAVRMTIKAAIL